MKIYIRLISDEQSIKISFEVTRSHSMAQKWIRFECIFQLALFSVNMHLMTKKCTERKQKKYAKHHIRLFLNEQSIEMDQNTI